MARCDESSWLGGRGRGRGRHRVRVRVRIRVRVRVGVGAGARVEVRVGVRVGVRAVRGELSSLTTRRNCMMRSSRWRSSRPLSR